MAFSWDAIGVEIGLTLEHQLCFALYSASRELQAAYRDSLAKLHLSYPQYLVMLILWESDGASVADISARMHLDLGATRAIVRRLEDRSLVGRRRAEGGDRTARIHLTEKGRLLKEHAAQMQSCVEASISLSPEEVSVMRDLAQKLLTSRWQVDVDPLP